MSLMLSKLRLSAVAAALFGFSCISFAQAGALRAGLAALLPDARIEELPGQAHEAMTTAPRMYAESVSRFCLG
jgi:hypothetical protein